MSIDHVSQVDITGSFPVPATGGPRIRLILRDTTGRTRLTPELIVQLLDSLKHDRQARLVTIEGSAGSFCEGLDLSTLAYQIDANNTQNAEIGLTLFAELLATIWRTPQLVIALVDGPALGGGVGLAAAADLVLASPRARFALPETLMGLIPAVVFPFVAHRVGVPRARLLALGADPLSAAEAHRWGLIDEVTDDFEAVLARYTRRFSKMDPRALASVKHVVATHYATPASYATDAVTQFLELLASPETQDRVTRFLAGESPWPEEDVA